MTESMMVAVRDEAARRGLELREVEGVDLASGDVVGGRLDLHDGEGQVAAHVTMVELGLFLGVLRVDLARSVVAAA